MSMTTELIKELRKMASIYKSSYCEQNRTTALFELAADTIGELSAKLQAANMERLSQYYHGGWIPVDERLPEEHDSIFAEFKNAEKWKATMFEKSSDVVLVTVKFYDGTINTEVSYTIDGKWKGDKKVIAWRPLPEPYQANDEEVEDADCN